MRSLGLDIGDKRIGVALSDPNGILASPLTVISRRGEDEDIEAIRDLVSRHRVGLVIVGLPRSLNGSLGHQAEKVKAFAQRLAERISVPLEYCDERLTTVFAERLAAGRGKPRSRLGRDAEAAALILQDYLDGRRRESLP